jgi:MFS family permease
LSGVIEEIRASVGSLARVMRVPALRRINLAYMGSVIGDWAFGLGFAVYAYDHGGAAAVGALAATRYVLMAVIGPLAASLGDRFPRRMVMIWSDIIRAVLVAGAVAAVQAGAPAASVFVLATATLLVGTAFGPAQAAILPQLVTDPADLTAANAARATIDSAGFFIGPAIAGLLLGFTGVSAVFLLNAVSFVYSAVLVAATPGGRTAAEREADASREPGGIRQVMAGFATILADRDLRLLVALFAAQCIIAGASWVFEVAIAVRLLHMGRAGIGYLDSVMGFGAVVGGVAVLMRARCRRLAADFGLGVLMWSVPLVFIATFASVWCALLAIFVVGLGNAFVDINAYTIVQRLSTDEVMARVFGALESALVAGMAIGALLIPLLISWLDIRGALAVLGIAIATLTMFAWRGLRRIDAKTAAPEYTELLRGVAILAPLADNVLERLARALMPIELAAGSAVFHEGDAGDLFYVIEHGEVDIVRAGEVVNHLGPGESFGEIALLRDVPRAATVVATTDVVLQALGSDVFIRAVVANGEAQGEAERAITRILGF